MTFQAVVIGASAGGLNAVRDVLNGLSKPFPLPLILVQHFPANLEVDYTLIYANTSGILIKEAEEKERPLPGWLYVAPPGYHLLIERDGTLSLSSEEPINMTRPSVDVLFETAAIAYKKDVIGVILTGAHCDGAEGLRILHEKGGTAIVENPDTAEVPGMPRAALQFVHTPHVYSCLEIGRQISCLAIEQYGEKRSCRE